VFEPERRYPDDNAKNPTAETVYWFYTVILGRMPDSTVFSKQLSRRYPKALIHLIQPDNEYLRAYTPREIADLIWYLLDNGVTVNRLEIVSIPDLLNLFIHRDDPKAKQELEKLVEWLRTHYGSQNSGHTEERYDRFAGWSS